MIERERERARESDRERERERESERESDSKIEREREREREILKMLRSKIYRRMRRRSSSRRRLASSSSSSSSSSSEIRESFLEYFEKNGHKRVQSAPVCIYISQEQITTHTHTYTRRSYRRTTPRFSLRALEWFRSKRCFLGMRGGNMTERRQLSDV